MAPRTIRALFDETVQGWPTPSYIEELTGHRVRIDASSSSPDFVFFGPHPRKKRWPWRFLRRFSPPTPEPRGRYVRIYWTGENTQPDFDRYDWVFDFNYEERVDHPRHMRKPVWHPGLPTGERSADPSEKTKFCNFIFSRDVALRNEFFDKLSRYKRVDAPGLCRTNSEPIGSHPSPFRSRYTADWEGEKLAYMASYKFTIAFENVSTPGYVTEKLYHPMLVDSIPIYWGNPEVHRDYNPKSFINVHDFASLDDVVNHVIQVDQDDELYRRYLSEPFYSDGGEAVRRQVERVGERLLEIFDTPKG